MTHRVSRSAVLLLLAAAVTAGCAGPSRTESDYRHKVANSAQAIGSSVGTAIVAVHAAANDHAQAPYLSVVLSQADDDASSVVDQLDTVQPPSAAMDRLRTKADALFQHAVTVLDDLRIAVRRGEVDRLAGIAQPLDRLSRRLNQLSGIAS